jgi:hypothetical protein
VLSGLRQLLRLYALWWLLSYSPQQLWKQTFDDMFHVIRFVFEEVAAIVVTSPGSLARPHTSDFI